MMGMIPPKVTPVRVGEMKHRMTITVMMKSMPRTNIDTLVLSVS